MRVDVVRPADPDPVRDVSTAEAAAEFKRLRDSGAMGPRNEAEYQEMLRLAAEREEELERIRNEGHELR